MIFSHVTFIEIDIKNKNSLLLKPKAFLKQSLSLSLEQALLAGQAFQGWVRLGLRLEAQPYTTLVPFYLTITYTLI